MKRLYIFDFDDTLFDTNRFYHQEVKKLGLGTSKHHHLPARVLRALRQWRAMRQGRFDHLAPDNSYLFDDVIPTITQLEARGDTCVIMSTGILPWQRYKLSLCPALSRIPRTIVLRNKGYGLYQRITRVGEKLYALGLAWGGFDEIVIVDDLVATFKIMGRLDGVRRIRLRRPGAPYAMQRTPDGVEEAGSLKEIL